MNFDGALLVEAFIAFPFLNPALLSVVQFLVLGLSKFILEAFSLSPSSLLLAL